MKNTILIRTLLLLLTLGILAVSITSCEREQIIETDLNEVQSNTIDDELVYFKDNTNTDIEVPDISEFQFAENEIEDRMSCCGATYLGLAISPWGLVNLNVKYDVSQTDQEVRIFHYKRVGSSWVYVGYARIGSSYSSCTHKSVNLSTGQLSSGNYWSVAIVYDQSSSCGNFKTLRWTL